MMSCWIVAGYMAFAGIYYTYNTIYSILNLDIQSCDVDILEFHCLELFSESGFLGELFSVDMMSIGYASAWSELEGCL